MINDFVFNEYIDNLGYCLVVSVNDVKMLFIFFMICDCNINVFVFFGGYVVLYFGLFFYV